MNEILTRKEIWTRFPDEWVLLDQLQTHETLGVQQAHVVHHSKDRNEILEKARGVTSKHIAIFYTGSMMPENVVLLL